MDSLLSVPLFFNRCNNSSNDSVEGTAFVIEALFHPSLKNASGMNERELKIAREIQEGIIKYLSDEEGE